jgi:hypothetical protein
MRVGRSKNGTCFVSFTHRIRSLFVTDASIDLKLLDISKDNKLRERVLSTGTLLWTDGLFNDLDIDVYNGDFVALRACHLSNIGDANPVYAEGGMRVWVSTGAETIDQYATTLSLAKWVRKSISRNSCEPWSPAEVNRAVQLGLRANLDQCEPGGGS